MCNEKVSLSSKTLKQFKEIVDYIYEATIVGHVGKFTGGTRLQCSVREMVKRGILLRTFENGLLIPTYKWFNPATHPTETLYRSIAGAIVLTERKYAKTANANRKAKAAKKAEGIVTDIISPDTRQPVVNEALSNDNPLEDYSVQMLWDELRRRGCTIENNKLVLIKKEVFE